MMVIIIAIGFLITMLAAILIVAGLGVMSVWFICIGISDASAEKVLSKANIRGEFRYKHNLEVAERSLQKDQNEFKLVI